VASSVADAGGTCSRLIASHVPGPGRRRRQPEPGEGVNRIFSSRVRLSELPAPVASLVRSLPAMDERGRALVMSPDRRVRCSSPHRKTIVTLATSLEGVAVAGQSTAQRDPGEAGGQSFRHWLRAGLQTFIVQPKAAPASCGHASLHCA
jgi:hypothetical protein